MTVCLPQDGTDIFRFDGCVLMCTCAYRMLAIIFCLWCTGRWWIYSVDLLSHNAAVFFFIGRISEVCVRLLAVCNCCFMSGCANQTSLSSAHFFFSFRILQWRLMGRAHGSKQELSKLRLVSWKFVLRVHHPPPSCLSPTSVVHAAGMFMRCLSNVQTQRWKMAMRSDLAVETWGWKVSLLGR